MSLSDIRPVIIARDTAETIGATLESLTEFPEVLVYDSGSTDGTADVCRRFANVRLVSGEFVGFGPTKNRAAGLAQGEWILSIDADERLGRELLEALRALDLRDRRTVYALNRHNLLLGEHVRHGGWGNNWIVRLYHRGVCAFDDARVHEKIAVPGGIPIVRLNGPLWHEAVTDLDQFLKKISLYTELRRGDGSAVKPPFAIFIGAAWAFFRSYVLQRGFLAGWRGLVIANCEAQGSFFKHIKRYVDAEAANGRAIAVPIGRSGRRSRRRGVRPSASRFR